MFFISTIVDNFITDQIEMDSLVAFEFELLMDDFRDNAVIRCALLNEEAPKYMADAFIKEAKDFFIVSIFLFF